MARFVFELEPVLLVRKREEESQQRDVAALQAQINGLEERIRACQQGIRREREELRDRLSGSADMGGVRTQAGAGLHLVMQAQRASIELAGVYKRQAAAREELARRAAKRRALELLREKRFEVWRREQARLEDAALDELAVMRASRGGGADERGHAA